MDVCVVGLGKVGLPLAVQIASAGHRVRGVDVDAQTVGHVSSGREPFAGEALLGARLRAVVQDGRLTATTDGTAAVASSAVVVVTVPLVVDDGSQPDFGAVDAATTTIGGALQPGTLVSYETTLPVHTTRQRLGPMLEAASGLAVGVDLFLCHSPERVYAGRVFDDLRRYPKLVGGTDPASTHRAVAFYESVLQFDPRPDLPRSNGVWDLGSAEAAELAKLVETTYRDVNIALANEFAILADRADVDVYRVIEAANSQPFSHVHQPGIAVGGHCIPVYPRLYLAGHPGARVPAAARVVNESMPRYAVRLLREQLGDLAGQRVVVLGAAYRGDVKEAAFSGVFDTVEALAEVGAVPVVHDPLYADDELRELGLVPHHLGDPVDAAVLQADHSGYQRLTPQDLPGVRALVDGRAFVPPDCWGDEVPRIVIGGPGDATGAAVAAR